MTENVDAQWDSNKRTLITFITSQEASTSIKEMQSENRHRFEINLDDIKKRDNDLWRDILNSPVNAIRILEPALNQKIKEENDPKKKTKTEKKDNSHPERKPRYRISFTGSLGRNLVTPRGLSANLVNSLVGVQGIVTRISLVKPKLIKSYHYCEETSNGSQREYPDLFDLSKEHPVDFTTMIPTMDSEGNPLTVELGYCEYRDFQTVLVQEMPEKAPPGMLPRSIEVVLEEDLVDKVKPGDRVEIIGVFKCFASGLTVNYGAFKSYLIANNVSVLHSDHLKTQVTPEEMMKFREIAKTPGILSIMSKSIAPSIFGHEHIKKALLLTLLGGIEKNLENGTHLRGDINVLLIGDPSTAKSQMLRHVLTLSPLSVCTTGRGSSGVGLTAAVAIDKDTGERHLEAGAMVLADKGVICIDEFDKMNEGDRVAIHEVMEQQTVTIAKAGIHASLNARCSVVAAANPIYGEYQKDLPPTRNIGLPDSLLSRFDLLFVVLDEKDSEIDRKVAERVTRNHMYKSNNMFEDFLYDDDFVIQPNIIDDSKNDVYEKGDQILYTTNQGQVFTVGFIRKYIQFAKKTCVPKLTEYSINYLAETWKMLRQKELGESTSFRSLPITIRTLESLIRLATAHAKLRLSKNVDKYDCVVASFLLHFALFNEENEDLVGELLQHEGKSHQPNSAFRQYSKTKREDMQEEEHKDGGFRLKEENASDVVIKKQELTPKKNSSKKGKMKRDEDQENRRVIDETILLQTEISADMKKTIYKAICELTDNGKKVDALQLNSLLSFLEKTKSKMNEDQVVKCLMVLNKENKIIFEESKCEILIL